MTYKDGRKYDGKWKGGKMEGHGVLTFPNGTVYKGDFKKDKANGNGVMTYFNHKLWYEYNGKWKDNKKEGKGVMTYTDGTKYDGSWKDGRIHGQGVFTFSNNSKYDGEIKNGLSHGYGVYTYADGRKYEGEFKNDKLEGRGVMTYKNGDKYNGEWKAGTKEGKGVMQYADGDKYTGQWKAGEKEGKGVMNYANGNKYEGRWRNDLRDGRGVMTYANGDKYVGEWKNDKRKGVKEEEKQRILKVDNWITQKVINREMDKIQENQKIQGTVLKGFDIIRNIQKYDPQSITGLQQNNTFKSLLQKLEKSYKKYMKTKFKIKVYKDKSEIPKNIFDYINNNMFNICRRDYLLTHLPTSKGDYIFVSQGGTSQNPVIGGVAVVVPYSAGGSGDLIGLDTNTTSGVEVKDLCSHMGQGAAILDEIRRWMLKFKEPFTVLELGPRNSAKPFYYKYGFKYFHDDGRMIMNVKLNDIRKKKKT